MLSLLKANSPSSSAVTGSDNCKTPNDLTYLELSLLVARSFVAHTVEENGERYRKNRKNILLNNNISYFTF